MDKVKITIFTPTYNREWILEKAYESLCKQEYKDFEWVIMDDGSTDGTKNLIDKWRKEDKIRIQYLFQKNQGRFVAFNNAKENFNGELLITLDSDDYLLDDALKNVIDEWENIDDKNNISGILAYIEDKAGNILGTEFPKGIDVEKIYVLYDKYRMKGDKFLIFRTDLVSITHYITYEGERFGGDSTVFNKINDIYPMHLYRQKICHREYQEDGLTSNMREHHRSSPNGMRDHYMDCLYHEKCNKVNIIKHIVGLVVFGKMTDKTFLYLIEHCPYKLWFILLYFPSIIYHRFYIK